MRNRQTLTLVFLAILIYTLYSSIFILDETKQAIVTLFGKPVGEPRTEAGLNFKIPYFHKVQYFDKRYLEWDGARNQVPTKDKKFIFVDTYARWEITNPLQFFIRLRDERSAQSRLDDILDGETRNAVASHDLLDLVRSSNRDPEITEEFMEQIEILEDINVGRAKIEKIVLEKANERTADLGVRVLDFRFKRMNYVDEVRDRVYDRMISERNRIADQFRSEGQGEARKIEGNKEKDLAEIQSEAFKKAEEIKGRADAEATKIYAAAYNRSRQSVDFYKFIRSMESFEKSLDENTTIILSSDSEFFRYLKKVD
ncbi:protease modulator HflC [Aquiflexum gelatinilyticum]|jgi:membrane protease subunit HflC|uniref:Protein HflC n=1 Tax=Aquiflexum gelatinilyticum TaxID=2961943 RepID=A0A9X2SZE9_9BACT|nr:protease modulator HflC [Aquiflexum gelatinilyticum]MCR9014358.1 protease modulator HflC [Aquiflexum gelatinilyticum]MCS4435794.1 protease modulator HflC [Aquiflexum gelatinilyticum]